MPADDLTPFVNSLPDVYPPRPPFPGLAYPLPAGGLFRVPDLDAFTTEQLAEAETVFGRLAAVAGYKCEEARSAGRGDPEQADGYRRCWQAMYAKLPAWARYADPSPKDSGESS